MSSGPNLRKLSLIVAANTRPLSLSPRIIIPTLLYPVSPHPPLPNPSCQVQGGDADTPVRSHASFTVTAITDTEEKELAVRPTDTIHDAIAIAFGCLPSRVKEVELGDDAVERGGVFEEWGIEASCHTLSAPSISCTDSLYLRRTERG